MTFAARIGVSDPRSLKACISSGLLFAARGGFLPYFFPLFQSHGSLSYAEVAVLLNVFLVTNSFGSGLVWYFIERYSTAGLTIGATIANCVAASIMVTSGAFSGACVAVGIAGLTFTMSRIAFNRELIQASQGHELRSAVSLRAVLMTLGSFIGNALTVWSLTRFGAPLQIVAVFTVFNLSWLLIWYGNPGRGLGSERTSARVAGSLGEVVRNRGFIRDIVRLFGALVPYGCWGTLLPKLVLDKFGNLSAIPLLYFASMTTIVTLTHLFNQGLAARLHKSGFDKRHWTSIAFLLFISGILMIGLSNSIAVMCVGAIVFALGEIVVTPRMDEATKENASDKPASIYIGWVQFVEGAARLIGAGIGLLIYGALASAAPVQHFSLSLCAVFSAIYAASLFSSRIASRGFSQKTVKGYT